MAVSPVNSVNSNPAADAANLPSQTLSQQDFLKLLVAQMEAQDPINPMDNKDMMAQMVQFSTLQGNTAMQQALSSMQTSQSLLQANSLLGRMVTVQTEANTLEQGVVSGVDVTSGTPQILINGTAYDLSQVVSITNPATTH